MMRRSAKRHAAPPQVARLQEEIARLKKEAADREWGITKTNEGVKILYKELEVKNRELQKLDQMKSDFVSTVSHELRTPMTIIKESIAQILDGKAANIEVDEKKLLTMALNNIDRLNRIVDNLLDVAKLEDGQLVLNYESVDLAALAAEVLEGFRPAAVKKGLVLDSKSSSPKITVRADRDKLIQVLTNLIGNAMKFTSKGTITVAVEQKDKGAECRVIDTGPGMAQENLPKVFDKFQQFSRKAGPGEKGTGLGLTISKGLVELHGGTIWVESELNKGTTFVFTLPKEKHG